MNDDDQPPTPKGELRSANFTSSPNQEWGNSRFTKSLKANTVDSVDHKPQFGHATNDAFSHPARGDTYNPRVLRLYS